MPEEEYGVIYNDFMDLVKIQGNENEWIDENKVAESGIMEAITKNSNR